MEKKKNVPAIRFKGFTEAWEQCKAKDLFASTADKGHTELPVLSATQDRGMVKRDDIGIKIFHDKKNEEGYKRVIPGQFVIHLRSFQGGFAHSAIEGITSPAYTVFGFQEPEKHNDNYWKYVFSSKEFIRRLETVTYGIRDGRSISYDEFLTMNFLYPKKEEQTRIAIFLDEMTDLITLHQRKVEKLQKIKKSMLEKMFPKNGEKTPEIRFAGFNDAWEQCKLGSIADIKTGSSDLKDADSDGEYPFFVRSENIERSNRYIFDGEAILIPGEGRLGDIYHYINGKFDYHQRVYKISGFEDLNTYGKFILYSLQRNFKQHALKFTAKATVDSLRLPMLVDFKIKLPNYKEQMLIGSLFSNLDHLITLHQRKVEKLQKIKKSMLEKMFV